PGIGIRDSVAPRTVTNSNYLTEEERMKMKMITTLSIALFAGMALTGCPQQMMRTDTQADRTPANDQRAQTREDTYVEKKADRQARRQQSRVDSRIDREADRATDRAVDRVFDSIFD